MAAPKPTKVYAWASGDAADIVEPTSGVIAQGWVAGETPPAPYMNALQGGDFGTAPWLAYLQTFEQQALTWPERQTFSKGFAASGQRSTIAGLDVTSGATVAGGLTTDTLTASGAVSAASLASSGSVSGATGTFSGAVSASEASVTGVAMMGTAKTANLAPAVLSGTVTILGSVQADLQVGGSTGNFTGTVTAGGFSGPQVIETRQAVTSLLNGWTLVGAGAWYYKDNANRLWLYVSASGGTIGPAAPLFQLPVGWRPLIDGQEIITQRIASGASQAMQLYVTSSGNVYVYGIGFTNGTTLAAPGFIANGSIWLGA